MKIQNTKEVIKQLKNYCISANFESTNSLFLPEPIKVGTMINGSDVLCTYIDMNNYDRDAVILWVIFDETESDLYGNDFTKSYIKLYDDGREEYGTKLYDEKSRPIISWKPNSLLDILNRLKEVGMSWITYQTELRIKDRKYTRRVVKQEKLTWDERLDMTYTRMFIDKYSNGRLYQTELGTLQEMLELGEVEYNKLQNKRNDILNEILNEL